MRRNYGNNDTNNNPSRQPILQPTIAAVPRTFEAQNRPQSQQQQQQASSWLLNNNNNNANSYNDNDDNDVDDDDDDGIVEFASTGAVTGGGPSFGAGVGVNGRIISPDEASAIAVWRERERRQRTIRVFMMFLLMLLLMEEEPNSSSVRHPKNRHNNLRKALSSSSKNRNTGNKKLHLTSEVYTSRINQDEHIRALAKVHPRYQALITKEEQRQQQQQQQQHNHNPTTKPGDGSAATTPDSSRAQQQQKKLHNDYNEQVVQWALALADIEKDEFDSNAVGGDTTDATTKSEENSNSNTGRRGLIMPLLGSHHHRDPEDDRKVYHYPWNSTGFYRGEWKRIDTKQSSLYWEHPTPSAESPITKDNDDEEEVHSEEEIIENQIEQQEPNDDNTDAINPEAKVDNVSIKKESVQTPKRRKLLESNSADKVVAISESTGGEKVVVSDRESIGKNNESDSEALLLPDLSESINIDESVYSDIPSRILLESHSTGNLSLSDHPETRSSTKTGRTKTTTSKAGITKKITTTKAVTNKNEMKMTRQQSRNATTGHSNNNKMLISAIDMERHMQAVLQNERSELFGVYVLPYGYHLQTRDDNNLTTSRYEEIRYDQNDQKILPPPLPSTTDANTSSTVAQSNNGISRLRAGLSSLSYATQQRTTTELDNLNNNTDTNRTRILQPVTLTRDSGRAAFQLFSRSIPAMKELSLVEGFIKLYDSTSPGYSTKKDLLLRVRGVLIHSIGRLSLTANADISQAAFIMSSTIPPPRRTPSTNDINGNKQGSTANSIPASDKQRILVDSSASPQKLKQQKQQQQQQQRRRRLKEALSDIKTANLQQIRNDAIELVDNQEKDTKQDEEWKLLATSPDYNGDYNITSEDELLHSSIDEHDNVDSSNDIEVIASVVSEDVIDSSEKNLKSDDSIRAKSLFKFTSKTTADGDYWYLALRDISPVRRRYLLDSSTLANSENDSSVRKELGTATTSKVADDTLHQVSSSVVSTKSPKNEEIAKKKEQAPWSDIVLPFPYVRDDENETIRKARTAASHQMPLRERALEANVAHCMFEINMDIEPVQWTIGSWRQLVSHHVEHTKFLNPEQIASEEEYEKEKLKSDKNRDNDEDEAENDEQTTVKKKRRVAANGGKRRNNDISFPVYGRSMRISQDQALVMRMIGDISSPNCDFASQLNVTALRTDWDATTSKAISYSFYMMLVCLTQILILLRQLLHSQSNATATRVSILCIGWQTVIDALLCLAHIYLSLAVQPLFTAFASVAFFKLLIFCVIEMKYMAIILQARNSSNGGQPIDVVRRQVAILHVRFYVALMVVFAMLLYVSDKYRLPYILALYSFWVPQIVLNVITEAKAPMHKYYVYGMSLTRLVVPLYMLALPGNFLRQVYPDTPSDVFTCEMLVLWVGIQTAILMGQSHYGARFMIPARFLPPKFDYSRPIPASMLPPGASTAILLYEQSLSAASNDALDDRYDPKASSSTVSSAANTSSNETSEGSETQLLRARFNTTAVTTRNRIRGNRQNRNNQMLTEDYTSTTRQPSSPTLSGSSTDSSTSIGGSSKTQSSSVLPPPPCCLMECSICYDGIDIRKRKDYMLAPCNHLFHRACLSQWMDVKMECPICRTELPAL